MDKNALGKMSVVVFIYASMISGGGIRPGLVCGTSKMMIFMQRVSDFR